MGLVYIAETNKIYTSTVHQEPLRDSVSSARTVMHVPYGEMWAFSLVYMGSPAIIVLSCIEADDDCTWINGNFCVASTGFN